MPHPLPTAPSRRRPLRWTALAALAALGLSACTGPAEPGSASPSGPQATGSGPSQAIEPPSGDPSAEPSAAASAQTLKTLQAFQDQKLDWEECEGSHECATLQAPLDYEDPESGQIELALVRTTGAGEGAQHLLLNPGGPGASGVDMVTQSLDFVVSQDVQQAYSVVGFDPRGVSRSAPVTCLSDAEMDQARQEHVDPSTDEGLEQLREDAAEFAAACQENTGEVLGHVDTETSAQDMELMRLVLGDAKLNFLGFSYGTSLGASYAEQFPQTVGRFVLDGAMDPSLSDHEVTVGQAQAFEKALHSWASWCLEQSSCPLSGTAENGVAQLQRLIAQVEENPMEAADGRIVPVSTFVSGLITPLYGNENWPTLNLAVGQAMEGSVDTMLMLADLNAGRDPDGTYSSNINSAFTAINCLDGSAPADTATLRAQAAELEEASPTLGRFLAYGAVSCEAWPAEPASEPVPVTAAGADPILVIGTRGDPATPYEWAPALADQLESGVLVTWNGEGHTAYGRAGECIGSTVDAYLVEGTVPEDGLVCD